MALLKKKSPDVMPPDLQNAEERLQQSDLVNTNVPKKKSASPALLGGGAVALVALALGGWYFLGARSTPGTSTSEEVVVAPRPPVPPPAPGRVASAPAKAGAGNASAKATARRVAPTARPGQNPRVTTIKRAAVNRPGRVGIKPPGVSANVPAFAPERPGALPRMVPVQGAPTPIPVPDGLEGTPGRRGGRNSIVISRPLAPTASPAQLKELWNQGAAAKQRGDLAAARRAWTRILQLSPGHPGIQSAINKLG